MYYDAHSAFNEGDWGGNSRGCTEGGRESGKGEGTQNIPIGHTGNGALLELHHVAGQSSRLVRENVFHLLG